MLKIEVIKFEAQDVITASTAACEHRNNTVIDQNWDTLEWTIKCDACGLEQVIPIPEEALPKPE